VKQVAAAIARQGERVLVTRRAPGQHLAGFWEFPGGKLEEGETVQTCIVRELREELGVGCLARDIIAESVHEYAGGAINLIAIAVDLIETTFSLTVHDDAIFVTPSELLTMQLAPADIPIARQLAEAGP
jgi:8-oxo-dGTP diphosphatase